MKITLGIGAFAFILASLCSCADGTNRPHTFETQPGGQSSYKAEDIVRPTEKATLECDDLQFKTPQYDEPIQARHWIALFATINKNLPINNPREMKVFYTRCVLPFLESIKK